MGGLAHGNPTPDDLHLGRGIPRFGIHEDNGFPNSYRDLGNATSLNASIDTESKEHTSSRGALRQVDREIPISSEMSVNLTLDTFSWENLSIFFLGETATEDLAATTASEHHYSVIEVKRLGESFEIFQRQRRPKKRR